MKALPMPASLPATSADFARRFEAALRAHYGVRPSSALVARDFCRLPGAPARVAAETVRKWRRGLAVPDFAKMQLLGAWLGLDLNAVVRDHAPVPVPAPATAAPGVRPHVAPHAAVALPGPARAVDRPVASRDALLGQIERVAGRLERPQLEVALRLVEDLLVLRPPPSGD